MEILNKNPNILSEFNFNSSKFMNLIEKNVSFDNEYFCKNYKK